MHHLPVAGNEDAMAHLFQPTRSMALTLPAANQNLHIVASPATRLTDMCSANCLHGVAPLGMGESWLGARNASPPRTHTQWSSGDRKFVHMEQKGGGLTLTKDGMLHPGMLETCNLGGSSWGGATH